MRNFKSEFYIELIENSVLPELNFFMKKEVEIIRSIDNVSNKTFIDLGAGHGRVMPLLSEIFNSFFAVEINPNMYNELNHRAKLYRTVSAIQGDMINLKELFINFNIEKPVLGLLQNTLGTIEGDWKEVLKAIKEFDKWKSSEIIISFFKAEAMNIWGRNKLFPYIKPMISEVNYEKSDLKNGILFTENNYTSKWWKKEEIEYILNYLNKNIQYSYENNIFKTYHLI